MDTPKLQTHCRMGSSGGPDSNIHHVSGPRTSVPFTTSTLNASPGLRSAELGSGSGSQGLHSTAAVPEYHQGASYTSSTPSLLLPPLPGHQERWPVPPCARPLQVEQIPGCPALQDGIHPVHRLGYSGAHVGMHSGSPRCFLPCAHGLAVPWLPGFCPRWPSVCFPVPSLRPGPSSLGVQQDYQPCEKPPSPMFRPCSFIPGRFFLPEFFSRRSSGGSGLRPGSVPEAGPLGQRQEVQPVTISEGAVSGCHLPSGLTHPHPARVQGGSDCVTGTGHAAPTPVLPTSSGEIDGPPELGVQLRPARQAASPTSHKVDESAHFPSDKGSVDTTGRGLQVLSPGLGRPLISGALNSHGASSSDTPTDDGCFEEGLVRGPSPTPGGRRLASGVCTTLLQCSGVASHSPVASPLRPPSQGKGSDGHDGQHHSRLLHSQSGILSVGLADGAVPLHSDILLPEQDHSGSKAYLRGAECPGGPGVPTVSNPDGMVTGSSNLQLAPGPGRESRGSQTSGGPLCHSAQCPSGQFCVACSGPAGGRSECPVTRLEPMVLNLPVSSGDAPQQASPIPVALQRPGYPGCSLSCEGSLVPDVDREMPGSGTSTEGPPTVSGHKQRTGVSSVSTGFAASRLDTMMTALRTSGFSQDSVDVASQAHRESTIRQYQAVWLYFLDFLAQNGLAASGVTAATVCNFLSFHAKAFGRKYRTLSAYKSALRHPILLACGVDINSVTTDFFLRGLFNFVPPERAKDMPQWSLEELLLYLQCPLFEPLRSAPFSRLLQKTLCLILLASGRRIGDVASLSRLSSPHPTYDALILKWVDGYVPKFRSSRWSPSVPSIGRLASDVSLCPIRAYREYLSRISPWFVHLPDTRRHPYLWVNNNRTATRMPKSQLTRWFISLVKDSRRYHNSNGSVPIGPHQCRKFAASYSVLLGQDLDRVLDIMGFSSPKIFHKNYVGPVPPLGIPCVFPGGPYKPVTS